MAALTSKPGFKNTALGRILYKTRNPTPGTGTSTPATVTTLPPTNSLINGG